MSRFTPSVNFKTSFDGDQVSMTLNRLKRKDAMRLAKFYSYDEEKKEGVLIGDEDELMEVVADILPRYVTGFNGLTSADGDEISLEQAIDEMYFMPLIGNILSELMNASSLDKDSEGNSGAPSGGDTQEHVTMKSFV